MAETKESGREGQSSSQGIGFGIDPVLERISFRPEIIPDRFL
jgi:hypothetical protein